MYEARIQQINRRIENLVRSHTLGDTRRHWLSMSGRYHNLSFEDVQLLAEVTSIPVSVLIMEYGAGQCTITIAQAADAFSAEGQGYSLGVVSTIA